MRPGDLTVADDDSVVVVKRDQPEECIHKVKEVVEREKKRLPEIESGVTTRPGLDEIMERKGLE